jgi:hypothetical protein
MAVEPMGGGEVTPTGPTEVSLSEAVKIAAQPRWESREQFIAEFAKTAFCWQTADTTQDAIDAFNKAFRNAVIAWNMMPDAYRKALVATDAETGKVDLAELT